MKKLLVVLLILPGVAFADMGLPLIAMIFPYMSFALIPILIIESYIIKFYLDITFGKVVSRVTFANIITTLIGVPLTWVMLFILQLVMQPVSSNYPNNVLSIIVNSPWVIGSNSPRTEIALMILFAFFFLVSWKIEYWVIKRKFKMLDPVKINKGCFAANLVTYLLLCILPVYDLLN